MPWDITFLMVLLGPTMACAHLHGEMSWSRRAAPKNIVVLVLNWLLQAAFIMLFGKGAPYWTWPGAVIPFAFCASNALIVIYKVSDLILHPDITKRTAYCRWANIEGLHKHARSLLYVAYAYAATGILEMALGRHKEALCSLGALVCITMLIELVASGDLVDRRVNRWFRL